MSDTTFVLVVILGGIFAAAILAGTIIAVAVRLDEWLRRRRRERQGLSDREVANSIDPGEYGVDISMWPSRAPRNGSTYEDVA
jgi:hypothetical protein